jgi:NAD(P)-dependent dehydrogenase (short-subunit alcohol dehydrogenase family)
MKTTTTLEGQTILIIGGTSGIGFGVALASLNNGAAKVIVASSSASKVDNAVRLLKAQAANQKRGVVKGVVIDGMNLVELDQSVKAVGQINHLVFTSGQSIRETIGKNITELDLVDMKGEHLKCIHPFSILIKFCFRQNL